MFLTERERANREIESVTQRKKPRQEQRERWKGRETKKKKKDGETKK